MSDQGTKQVQSKRASRREQHASPNHQFGISPRLLDVKQAAFYLGISDWTVRELISAGTLSRVKIPRPHKEGKYLDRHLLDVRDLDRFIESLKDNSNV